MTEATFRCSNCGAALDSPDSICLRCDPELQPPNRDPNMGKYRCPSCSCRFDSPVFTLWPPTAKWYVPQGSRLTCPHCGKHLRDRHVVERTPIELGVAVVIVVASLFLPWRPGAQYALLIVIVAVDFVRARRAKQSVAHAEERYAVAKGS